MVTDWIIKETDRLEQERLKRIARAWLAYQGDLPAALKATKTDPEGRDNVRINIARLLVDTSVSYLFHPDTAFECDNEEAQRALDEILTANNIRQILFKLAVNGAVCGHAFLKLTQGRTASEPPRIVVLDPSTVTIYHETEDIDDVFAYRIQWHGVDHRNGKSYVRRQIIERNEPRTAWTITDEISYSKTPSAFGILGSILSGKWEALGPPVIHPFPWSPVHHCQNLPAANQVWGAPDLDDDVVALNSAINANRSYVQRITRLYAHPQPVVTGASADDVVLGPDTILTLPTNSTISLLEMRSDLSGVDTAYHRLMDAIHSVTNLPQVATGRTEDLGALSGVALKILYGPLLARTSTKQMLYGPMLEDLMAHALNLAGYQTEPVQVRVVWPNILPEDEQTKAATAETLKRIGVSTDTLLTSLGYDAEAERAKRQEEVDVETEIGARMLTAFEKGQTRLDQ